jgi:hypothetical protein
MNEEAYDVQSKEFISRKKNILWRS